MAKLTRANLASVDLRGAKLDHVVLDGVQTNAETQWPEDFVAEFIPAEGGLSGADNESETPERYEYLAGGSSEEKLAGLLLNGEDRLGVFSVNGHVGSEYYWEGQWEALVLAITTRRMVVYGEDSDRARVRSVGLNGLVETILTVKATIRDGDDSSDSGESGEASLDVIDSWGCRNANFVRVLSGWPGCPLDLGRRADRRAFRFTWLVLGINRGSDHPHQRSFDFSFETAGKARRAHDLLLGVAFRAIPTPDRAVGDGEQHPKTGSSTGLAAEAVTS